MRLGVDFEDKELTVYTSAYIQRRRQNITSAVTEHIILSGAKEKKTINIMQVHEERVCAICDYGGERVWDRKYKAQRIVL